nr:MAG TPA: hypothetical protein [Caudoviricetes sp.]
MKKAPDALLYYVNRTKKFTLDRCYAIHLLKLGYTISVYRQAIRGDSLIEWWSEYLPRRTRLYRSRQYESMDVNTIIGSYWNKHQNRHIVCRMPATKEVKYLKNYRVE